MLKMLFENVYEGYSGLPKHIKLIFRILNICFIVIIDSIYCCLAIAYCLPWGLGPPGLQPATAAAVGLGAARTAMGHRRRRGAWGGGGGGKFGG